MGSKSRIAKYIVPIIQKYINENDIAMYIEPFVGGANIIDKIEHNIRIGVDINPYLIALLKRVQNGEPLYEEVPKELYDNVRTSYNNKDNKYADWEYGNVGFLASYNGRFFDGGYGKSVYEKLKNGKIRYRDYYRESKDNILSQNLKGITFEQGDYKYLSYANCVIYCDPPYFNSTATYNENGGWTNTDEEDLRDMLAVSNVKWALSNNLKTNPTLKNWAENHDYKIHYLNTTYGNCNYQKKDKAKDIEVLITNY